MQRSGSWLAAFATKTQATLDRFERDAPSIAAKPFDVGHFAMGCALSYLEFRFTEFNWREARPAPALWHAAFLVRPSAKATEAVDD